METLKIEVSVKLDLSEATKSFIESLTKVITAPAVSATPTTSAAKPVAPAAPATPTVPAAKPVTPATPTVAKPVAPVAPVTPATPTIGIEDVRKALAAKINGHREEIKAKLNSLGAPSVTKLDSSKYSEMFNFLSALA